MTDEEIRIKVAEAMGWKRHDKHETGFGAGQRMTTGLLRPDGVWVRKLPDYPESLDACAEFEKTLTDEELEAYREHISELLNDTARIGVGFTAKPKIRCLAYLKTKGILP